MNEIATITADWSEAEQKFAEILVGTLKRKHKELGDPPVLVADITICLDDFKEASHLIQGIDRHRDSEATAEWMLRSLWERDETDYIDACRLAKHGRLYKHLQTELEGTP